METDFKKKQPCNLVVESWQRGAQRGSRGGEGQGRQREGRPGAGAESRGECTASKGQAGCRPWDGFAEEAAVGGGGGAKMRVEGRRAGVEKYLGIRARPGGLMGEGLKGGQRGWT